MNPQPAPPSDDDDASRLREDVLGWFIRRDRDGWNAADEAAFQAWLRADARHRSSYAQWQAHWHAMDAIPADAVAQLRSRLERDKAVLAQGTPRSEGAGPSRRRVLAPALALAGVAAITAGTGLVGWRQWQAQPVFTQAFRTERGQQTDVQLPDGSRMRLGTATRLEVNYYRRRREVRLLDGQAVFSVQADARRPFDVLAAATRAAVRIARHEAWRRDRLAVLVAHFRRGAAQRGIALLESASPIQPVRVGDSARASALSRALEARGFYVPAIRPPTVPTGAARLRVTLSALHAESDVEALLDALHAALHEASPA